MSRDKTLQELDGQDWGEPTYGSYVVVNCHRLRCVPLKDFTIEDLRLMIGQDIGREHLVPIALEHLERDPLVAGDLYEGDLLNSVSRVPEGFWREYPDLHVRWPDVLRRADNTQMLNQIKEAIGDLIDYTPSENHIPDSLKVAARMFSASDLSFFRIMLLAWLRNQSTFEQQFVNTYSEDEAQLFSNLLANIPALQSGFEIVNNQLHFKEAVPLENRIEIEKFVEENYTPVFHSH